MVEYKNIFLIILIIISCGILLLFLRLFIKECSKYRNKLNENGLNKSINTGEVSGFSEFYRNIGLIIIALIGIICIIYYLGQIIYGDL